MDNFWKQLIINVLIRILTSGLIYVASKGFITHEQAGIVAIVAATMLFNVGQTVVNRILAKWHVDLAVLLPDKETLNEASKGTPTMSKLSQVVTGTQQAIQVTEQVEVVSAEDTKPDTPSRDTTPLVPPNPNELS